MNVFRRCFKRWRERQTGTLIQRLRRAYERYWRMVYSDNPVRSRSWCVRRECMLRFAFHRLMRR